MHLSIGNAPCSWGVEFADDARLDLQIGLVDDGDRIANFIGRQACSRRQHNGAHRAETKHVHDPRNG